MLQHSNSFPLAGSVTWSINPSSGIGTKQDDVVNDRHTTLTGTTNGDLLLTATLNNSACAINNLQVSKNIHVGVPGFSTAFAESPEIINVCRGLKPYPY